MRKIADIAYRALIKEVELTPKPGLVDKNNNGAHNDMDIDTFYNSSITIKPFVEEFLNCGLRSLDLTHVMLFEKLREIGKLCEKEMFIATDGVNTHKGMIFNFAVICGAIGRISATKKDITSKILQNEIKKICKNLILNDLLKNRQYVTNGINFYNKTKFAAIRDEAQNGYTTIIDGSLPFYKRMLKNYTEDVSLKLTLLFLMSKTMDSNLFARGGMKGIEFVQSYSKKILNEGKISLLEDSLKIFDKKLIQKNLSPGGSADLLCITWFLSEIGL